MRSEVFEKYSKIVDENKQLILDAAEYIYANPEIGFKEFKTNEYLINAFQKLGYTLHKAEGITGFYTDIYTGKKGPTLLILGELDAVICAEHEYSDRQTGAVHACGHHCQTSALFGIAAALKSPGALDGLCGTIRLCAVPAEELLDTEYREELRKKGIIKYMGGKVEFLYRGYFDDVDLAFMVHTRSSQNPYELLVRPGSNGCVSKCITIKGKASHAGGSPYAGINALYAANLGLNAINALRETFIDEEHTRVHSIITEGGQMVNAIPSQIRIETQVRGRTNEAIKKVNDKVNRAFASAAASMGAKCEIHDRPGYSPVNNDLTLIETARRVMPQCTDRFIDSGELGGGCSDMGDIMAVIPGIHPYVSGATGSSHGPTYKITNADSAIVFSAKFQLTYMHELLKDNAAVAEKVIANAKLPYKSKEEYFKAIDSFYKDKEAVIYNDDGTITIDVL